MYYEQYLGGKIMRLKKENLKKRDCNCLLHFSDYREQYEFSDRLNFLIDNIDILHDIIEKEKMERLNLGG